MKNIFVFENSNIHEVMKKLQKTGERCLVVVNKNKRLLGTINDGDIRRAILNQTSTSASIKNIYEKKCIYVQNKKFEIEKILKIIKSKKIDLVPVLNNNKIVINYLTLKEIEGLTSPKKIAIDVIIMAGGRGTRLKPFTHILPKPLIPLKDKTVIEKIIDNFRKFGVKKFIISINYKSKIIKSFFDELNPNYKYKFIEEKKSLGTAGSLGYLQNKIKKDYFITNCDTLMDFDYNEAYKVHKENKNDITVVVSSKKFTIPYGVCKINKSGLLNSIQEKPSQHSLINTGMYVVNNQIFRLIKKSKFLNFTDLILLARKKNKKVGIYPISERSWLDVGQWGGYEKTLKRL